MRKHAEKFLTAELDALKDDSTTTQDKLNKLEKLGNLLMAMGGTFQAIMDSNRAERRVFSIAFSDQPDREILEVLKLGVAEGYLHESTIGNKEGTGRTRLYIMSRRLAPCFNLDPTSFAGYLFVTSDKVREAMHNPGRLIRQVTSWGVETALGDNQLHFFDV